MIWSDEKIIACKCVNSINTHLNAVYIECILYPTICSFITYKSTYELSSPVLSHKNLIINFYFLCETNTLQTVEGTDESSTQASPVTTAHHMTSHDNYYHYQVYSAALSLLTSIIYAMSSINLHINWGVFYGHLF